MKERIFIGVAWPYANGPLHMGHLAGCYLPADIFARYHRLKGNDVLMVSGSDQHGTPVTISAEQQNVTPQQIVEKYHNQFLSSWEGMGISFDLFTHTRTKNHEEVVHDLFSTLLKAGYIRKYTASLAYCTKCKRFLPDRYVEGICPSCHELGARGDQCDKCGKTLNPEELIDIQCKICSSTPEYRESEHFFLRLSEFEKPLTTWVKNQKHWRANALNFTLGYLKEGLNDRAITRDIGWGVSIPQDGYEDKRIYVWFEAVAGYLSAAKEWAQIHSEPERWKDFLQNPSSKTFYFIGKDNIPFHTIIWPAMLIGYGGINLPYNVPSNEFLNLDGVKLSTSRNWALWLTDYLEKFEPDPLRYVLTATMPETSDSNFSWSDFVRRNNQELVATYGNLVHRVLSMSFRYFDGKIPSPGKLDEDDNVILNRRQEILDECGTHLESCNFRQALSSVMTLAKETNKYIDYKSPWKTIKTDNVRTATTLWVATNSLSCLKVLTYPFMPFSSQKLNQMLGFNGNVREVGWNVEDVIPGQGIPDPQPLFTKFDDANAEDVASHKDTNSF